MFAGANATDDDENLPIDSIDALMNFMTSFCRILRQGLVSESQHDLERSEAFSWRGFIVPHPWTFTVIESILNHTEEHRKLRLIGFMMRSSA